MARRLLGCHEGSHELEERLDLSNPQQATAWARCADYLTRRLQSTDEEKPGRPPDMSPAAAAAMRAVLTELGKSASAWLALRRLVEDRRGGGGSAEGLLTVEHSAAAREEAARKLLMNHFRVRRDLCNPSPSTNIEGKPLTQKHTLRRLAVTDGPWVDQFLRETTRRCRPSATPEHRMRPADLPTPHVP